ncbi:enoyl-CoA hydratase/isomerase family protein [Paracoccus aerius]|uniref:enoyl-CoA hydratase/isomerase family protein n=1 Tax=Paracoccus aerius TaxID=1915382 RepID=UPI0036123360
MNTPLITRQDHNGVALVTIDNPPVNALGQTARQQLCAMIARLDQDDNIRAVVLTGQGKVFVGGADISEFDRPPEAPHLPDAISAIEASRKPWVAAINGAALGGGAELALGCHYRILANSARIALPETKLGIIPGAGGTQRLPRLIGNALATDVITNGREIAAAESLDIGFADRAAAGDLIEEALDFAQQIASKPLPVPAAERPLADPGAHFWNTALKRITKAARGNPAPAAALSAIRTGTTSGFAAGMAQERETFLSLRGSEEAAALRYLFFAERLPCGLPACAEKHPRP